MKVFEMIKLLELMPQDAEIGVKHEGYYVEEPWQTLDVPELKLNDKVQVCHLYCKP